MWQAPHQTPFLNSRENAASDSYPTISASARAMRWCYGAFESQTCMGQLAK
jgi:hypothetical protein